jgi:hypothetical protein
LPEPVPAARPAATEVLDRVPRHRYALQTIRAFLDLVLSAPCSGRAAAWVLRWCGGRISAATETPCANTGRTWLFRLGLDALTCPLEQADDWVWLVDHTVQLGSQKGMIVVGLRLGAWQAQPRPLEHADVQLLHLEPMERSNGELVQRELEKAVARTGVPRAIVSDGGSDLKRGVALFCQDHPTVTHTYDIKHKTACLLKKELDDDPDWERFVSRANLARRGLALTAGAFLVPPSLSAKARYMNADRLVAWGVKVLRYLDHPPQTPGLAVKERLREARLGWLREYRQQLAEWCSLFTLAQAAEHYVRHHGLHTGTVAELAPRLQALAVCPRSRRMQEAIVEFLAEQSAAARPGERLIGSTEVLESIIGKYKRLQSMHSGGGMTGMLLSVGALVGHWSRERIAEGLQRVTNSQVGHWCRERLGVTLQAQRKLAFAAEQFQYPKPLARIARI